jgi:SHS family lactate transporter-like MFS transporter
MSATKEMAWWREPTRAQWTTFGAAWTGWVLDAFDFTIFLLAMPAISKHFGVSHTATAFSITLTLLTRLAGGFVAGSIADKYGRKLPLMISIVWFAVCDGAVVFAPSFAWVLVLRTLFGFGMGAEWTSGSTLAMENWPARSRGIASGVLQGSWAVGYFMAAWVFGLVEPIWGWRALFAIAVLPALLVLPIRIWVPESLEFEKQKASGVAPRFAELLQEDVLKKLAWASAILALGFAAYYGLTSLYPTMLAKELALDSMGVARMVALFNVGMMVGAVACGVLASKTGVRIAVFVPAVLMVPCLPLYVGVAGPLGLGAFLGGLLGAGYSGVTPALLADLFPARIRARASGLVYHIGAGFAAFVPPLITTLTARWGYSLQTSIALVSGVALILLAMVIPLKPRAAPLEDEGASISPSAHA